MAATGRLRPLFCIAPAVHALLLLCCLWPALALGSNREAILDFAGRIRVNRNAGLDVVETITMRAGGKIFRRGIYRDIAMRRPTGDGGSVAVAVNIQEVLRDGESEPYDTERLSGGGLRVYIGDEDELLNPGRHTYTLSYRIADQLLFHKDRDELYWNVTGDGWKVPIEAASASVSLPEGARVVDAGAYTGRRGSKEREASVADRGADVVEFAARRALAPGEGLTISLAWDKGLVSEPVHIALQGLAFSDMNAPLTAALAALVLLSFFTARRLAGRDPAKGTIIPRFAPPRGLSPAAVRFVSLMRYDAKSLTAAVVSMAVKGAVRIEQSGKTYTLTRNGEGAPDLSVGEREIRDELFSSDARLVIEKDNRDAVRSAGAALKEHLRAEFRKAFFRTNILYFAPGALLTLLLVLRLCVKAHFSEELTAVALSAGVGSVLLSLPFARALQADRRPSLSNILLLLLGAVLLGLFFLGAARETSCLSAGAAALSIAACALFHHTLKKRTVFGRRVMDEIDGFRTYLSVAEEKRLNALTPPDKTPELFERLLPYALALDVEQAWCERFSDVLAAAGEAGRGAYAPAWYSGSDWSLHGPSRLGRDLGDGFAGAVGSAAKTSSSGGSGGSFGGGFSGGGFGGMGGGGW